MEFFKSFEEFRSCGFEKRLQHGILQSKEPQASVQFSCSVMSNSLQPHGLQHARPPCPSPTPGVYSNSSPLSRWCHPAISPAVVPFSFCLQSFPESGSFQMNQFFASGAQSIGVSASASVLPMNIQDWFPLGLIGWISLQSKGLSRVFSSPTVQKHQLILQCSVFFMVRLSHPYMTTGKTIALTRQTFVSKAMPLLFNILSRFVIAFLPRSKHLLISWLQSLSAVILEPKKEKSVTVSPFFPSICHEVMGTVKAFIFLSSKITEDSDWSHEIKRCLLLGRKALTNIDSALKSRDITLLTNVCIV